MQITDDKIKDNRRALQVGGTMAPREAVGALLSLANGDVSQLLTSRTTEVVDGSRRTVWTLLGLDSVGLSVVTATGEDSWEWGTRVGRPDDRTVIARWVPVSQIRAIELRNIVLFRDQMWESSSAEIVGREEWVLCLVDGTEFVLPDETPEGENAHATTRFVRAAQKALAP